MASISIGGKRPRLRPHRRRHQCGKRPAHLSRRGWPLGRISRRGSLHARRMATRPRWLWAFYSARRAAGQRPNRTLRILHSPSSSRSLPAATFSARRMLTICTSAPDRATLSTCTASWPKRAANGSAADRPFETPPSTPASTRSAAAPAADACARTSFSSVRFRSRCPASSAKSPTLR